ncbi:MAG: hypothetical protein VX564_06075 [Nitrospirota bacterium]|nr:hypothetical protein [Nitrospirota bacterium]
MMVRILTGECSEEERMVLAISAQEVLMALEAGYGVQLEGVVLQGNLILDTLPLGPLPNLDRVPAAIKDWIGREQLTKVRSIQGPILFHEVDIQGTLSTNLINRGFIFFHGPLSITHSTFQKSSDFSRAIFFQETDFSHTTIRYEGFFIQAVFLEGVQFDEVKFGSHTRFHKAVFSGPSSFQGVEFPGLAEFLEVGFEKKIDFSHVHFMQGTGFSGSKFQESPDFSQSVFDRETFFRFTQFEKGAKFRAGMFHNTADFTEARFGGETDFSMAVFDEPPQFTDERLAKQFRPRAGLQNSRNLSGLFVLAGLFLLFFYYLFRRQKAGNS